MISIIMIILFAVTVGSLAFAFDSYRDSRATARRCRRVIDYQDEEISRLKAANEILFNKKAAPNGPLEDGEGAVIFDKHSHRWLKGIEAEVWLYRGALELILSDAKGESAQQTFIQEILEKGNVEHARYTRQRPVRTRFIRGEG
jgi:hypothetical protein